MRNNRFLRCILFLLATVIVATGCQTATESKNNARTRAQEDGLQAALKYTREAIQEYTRDHGKPPRQLEDLVTAGYFAALPTDPMTEKADWTIEFLPCDNATPCEKRIKDVHSSVTAKSSKGNLYSEW